MMQTFSNAEGQKRATTGSGDAQSNGAMAVYTLQRDIRQAGYGFNAINALGCAITLPAPASRTLTQLAPVIINPPVAEVPAGDANTDTLLIAYGSSEGSPEGDAITSLSGTQHGMQTPTNFRVGHRVVAAPAIGAISCALTMATVSAITPSPNITITGSGAVEGGSLFNLGATPRYFAYAIRAGNLTVCDYMAADCGAACTATDGTCSANWLSIANNIVSLRAQYGRDTNAVKDGGIDIWDQTTPPAFTAPTPAPALPNDYACLWARASAVRIAVVARNSQVDKEVLTGQAPVWEGSAGAAINLTARANWQNYRYKTFETIIPLRNLPWMATC
jgi:type IV pilus assembly protein PilW